MVDGFGMDENTATNGTKQSLVEIKRASEDLPRRDPRINC